MIIKTGRSSSAGINSVWRNQQKPRRKFLVYVTSQRKIFSPRILIDGVLNGDESRQKKVIFHPINRLAVFEIHTLVYLAFLMKRDNLSL